LILGFPSEFSFVILAPSVRSKLVKVWVLLLDCKMLPLPILDLAEKFRSLPGVGIKSSQKIAIDILQLKSEDYEAFINSLNQAKTKTKFCIQCGFFASKNLCEICDNKNRNQAQICLVEKPTDILSLEKSEVYRGVYHVLNKLISPLDNVFAENTTIEQLVQRINYLVKDGVEVELILFLKPGFASEATTAYIKETLTTKGIFEKVNMTKMAQGLPLYYNPETLDSGTILRALEDRREI
jgi:recombination protein RecR